MAFSKRPTFLKRQKEQQRLARATRKREERLARKRAKTLGVTEPDNQEMEPLDDMVAEGTDDLMESDDAAPTGRESGEEARN